MFVFLFAYVIRTASDILDGRACDNRERNSSRIVLRLHTNVRVLKKIDYTHFTRFRKNHKYSRCERSNRTKPTKHTKRDVNNELKSCWLRYIAIVTEHDYVGFQ